MAVGITKTAHGITQKGRILAVAVLFAGAIGTYYSDDAAVAIRHSFEPTSAYGYVGFRIMKTF